MCRAYLLSAIMLLLASDAIAQSQLYGLDFSPYMNGQDPNLNAQITVAQLTTRMQVVAPYTKWVRSFSSTDGLENTPSVARQFGLKVAANAWISSNSTQNTAEIANLIAAANAGQVDIAIVGSESLLRNDVSEAQLISYMNQVRQAIPPGIPVTAADTYGTLLAHPNVIAASDVVFGNFYPYWEGTSVNNAICALAQEYHELVAAAGNKPVIISETGWPSAGNAVGAAIPSSANAAQYFIQFVSWASSNNIPYFYFEAFDENWKAAYEGPQGAYWGIWDATGTLKPGMQPVFSGQASPVTCNGTIGGPGTAAISFTYVPPYGSSDALEGQVLHVSATSYGIAVYIYVVGGWWSKPTYAQPVTSINVDGTWSAAIVTGGSDQFASMIAAFLIPSAFSPPPLDGAPSLPASLTANSVAQIQIQRTQNSVSGAVTDSLGHPVANVAINGGSLGAAISAPDGKYSFFNIPASGSVTLIPAYPNFVFTPPSAIVNITSGNQPVNFSGASTVDLSITSTVSSSQVSVGSNVTATLVISNAGLAGASDAIATVSLPSSFTVTSVTSTRGACSNGSISITCDVGALAGTAYATITLIATPTSIGSFNLTASVSGPDPDAALANNTTNQGLTVVAASNQIARAVLRDTVGSIRLSTYASTTLSNSGGLFASDPSIAEDLNGNTFVTARDSANSIWTNVYNSTSSTWSGWRLGGGAIQGVPSIAVDSTDTGWIASRDNFNSYWLLSYNPGSGYGAWTPLGGAFSTDPVAAACGDGSIYLIGKDSFNALWSGRYIPGTVFQGFVLGGGAVKGKPSVSCGNDNAAYIVARDNFSSNWAVRVAGNTWGTWFNGGAAANIDPRIASLSGSMAVVILDAAGAVWRNTFNVGTGNGWQTWTGVGGSLQHISPAGVNGQLLFAGRAPNGDLWWWQQTGSQWTWIGNNGVAAGALSAAPR